MYQRILVPVDGSATAGRGLTEAVALARTLNAYILRHSAVPVLMIRAPEASERR